MELNHLVRIGDLASQQESEWALPSFIIPQKDGRVRWTSGLHQSNKVIRRKQYPLPIMGSTKRTLCGILLFKLNTFFSHVFAGP
jgi:hypothetical protein